MAQWTIDKVEISGGYLADFSLRLPAGLICVIGPRGSGKSTLAEAIRYVLTGPPQGAPKARADLIKANLGNTIVTLITGQGPERGGFTIRRSFGQPPILTSADGRPVSAVDLDRGTFLPIDAYSSLEMEAIADEALGTKRRTLLDELSSTELQAIHLQLAEQRRALESNADAIQAAQRRIGDANEQLEELGDVKGRLNALPVAVDAGGSQEFQAASKQRQFNEAEDQAIRRAAESVEALRAALSSLLSTSGMPNSASLQVEGSANSEIVRLVEQSVAKAWARVEEQLDGAVGTLNETLEDIQSTRASLDARHAEQEDIYLTQRQQNQEAALAVQARTAAERDVRLAAELAGRLGQEKAALATLHAERKTLKADYLLTRDKISQIREKVASGLQTESGPKVRIRVQRNADVIEYQKTLIDSLHGSKLKNQDDILRTLSRIRPEDLAQIIRDDDLQELDAHCAFGKERGRKILDSLRAGINPLPLEILPIDDAVSIELNVSTTAPENYKDASELSRGQKCTALLPILLARRETPLIIDQPEDNLDNHFIYQTVVESIRRLKAQRQMIFITHNANIPVLGEAELVVVMNSDGKHGYIEKSGSVDQCRGQIIDLLEGGEEAFALRRRRYGA